ncbi:MAG: DUF3662 domain-containing protein [Chloroflexi bacterium]|nr:DUF3662 domain-containing protein [Chloroflexota bacterium]
MSANPIDKLERQLQELIEGAFSRLFRRTIKARDIALLLLRAMEDNAALAETAKTKPIAPDTYAIYLEPENAMRFLTRYPDLPARLAAFLAELSSESGFQLLAAPAVAVLADGQLATYQARVTANHSPASSANTESMTPLPSDAVSRRLLGNAHLHIVGEGVVPLAKSVINIGRDSDNDLVIDDDYVSRHHAQLRKRFGVYTLFDVNSRGGAMVNSTVISERRLQSGDVIRMGHTDLIYADDYRHGVSDDTTQVLPPS